MIPYIFATLGMLIVAYLSYTQGFINGERHGVERTIEEDLIRIDASITHTQEIEYSDPEADELVHLRSTIMDAVEDDAAAL